MRIVHIAAEFAPIAKAGGLGEVVTGLCRELTQRGEEVEVILPKYDFIDSAKLTELKIEIANFKCLGYNNALWSARVEGCHLRLLEARHPAGYFHRGKIYGCVDDTVRFIYFSRAALEYLKLKKEPIDILHLHDWHASLSAPLVKDFFQELNVKAIVLSIHNVEYQGKCAVNDLDQIGLKGADYLTKERLQDDQPQYPETINLLKGGIVYADAIVPVSPTYAKEILTPEYAFHLHPTLHKMASKITGILNGIDQKLWDPSRDPYLTACYNVESAVKAKEKNKESFPLDPQKKPWVGVVSRLVPQKAPELIEVALRKTVERGGTFLLLGSSPLPELQEHFEQLKEEYRGNPHVFLEYQYNEPLAHQIYAALDCLIVPSHFEPCGLTQLIAMRYGTIPLVRATGGLKDTVFDCEDPKVPIGQRNGFCFSLPTEAALTETMERMFRLFDKDPMTWRSLMRRGMLADFSWKKPTGEYLKLYRQLLVQSSPPFFLKTERVNFSSRSLDTKL